MRRRDDAMMDWSGCRCVLQHWLLERPSVGGDGDGSPNRWFRGGRQPLGAMLRFRVRTVPGRCDWRTLFLNNAAVGIATS